jgi:hypothetical protein
MNADQDQRLIGVNLRSSAANHYFGNLIRRQSEAETNRAATARERFVEV